MRFNQFSKKQLKTLLWWNIPEYKKFDAIIADGAVRSGKTLSMSLGFIIWAMAEFNDGNFAFAGKTVTSLKRNVITPLKPILAEMGFKTIEKLSKNYMEVTSSGRTNRFYFFGGKDEGSAALIQGMTLCGVLLDEVALMPRSFVEQALARCSVNGAKFWFNCNPEHPYHWFYLEWILKSREKNALYIHFTMGDNPSLSKKILNRYKSLYSGVFYDRFILGKWIAAAGLVYTVFDKNIHVVPEKSIPICQRYMVSCDYGTVNPSSFGLWGFNLGVWYRIREYYYASKTEGRLRTDEEHYNALVHLTNGINVEKVIVDPSAASFMECIRRHEKFSVFPAKNDVISGIRRVSDFLKSGKILFSDSCADSIREFSLYVWDEKGGCDSPIKENDHAMDDIRYFVNFIAHSDCDGFFVASLSR